ncbi:MAG: class I SAM-dependent methyltransferase [Chromatiaceae bacterium]|nr:MAG: class I SAM-dependent methyltransferase [Chromatiaceae bacterium]
MPRVDTDSFYRHALTRYGVNAEGVHWHSAEHQRIRFQVLRDLLPARLDDLTLVDVGCGLGDLHRWLAARHDLPRRYIGIDAVPAMVELARARTGGCPILHRDVLQDPLPAADWYLASGALSLLTRAETRPFIERCLTAAHAGLVFNLLKGRDHSLTFNYMYPDEVMALVADLPVDAEVVEGYLSEDFSVALRHQRET